MLNSLKLPDPSSPPSRMPAELVCSTGRLESCSPCTLRIFRLRVRFPSSSLLSTSLLTLGYVFSQPRCSERSTESFLEGVERSCRRRSRRERRSSPFELSCLLLRVSDSLMVSHRSPSFQFYCRIVLIFVLSSPASTEIRKRSSGAASPQLVFSG